MLEGGIGDAPTGAAPGANQRQQLDLALVCRDDVEQAADRPGVVHAVENLGAVEQTVTFELVDLRDQRREGVGFLGQLGYGDAHGTRLPFWQPMGALDLEQRVGAVSNRLLRPRPAQLLDMSGCPTISSHRASSMAAYFGGASPYDPRA